MYPNIRALRNDHDLTQKQIARYLHMSQRGYSKYETGETDIPTSILLRLAELYRVSVDYLLFDPEHVPSRKSNLLAAMQAGLYRDGE